jgi:hypothetical protein
MRRNPQKSPHRDTAANQRKTEERISQFYGKAALLATWESMPDAVQIEHHDYIIELKANVRRVKNYLLHRADRSADLV